MKIYVDSADMAEIQIGIAAFLEDAKKFT